MLWNPEEHCRVDRHLPLVPVKAKVKFTLEQATKIERESRGIALFFS
jgi:hypothetical protein